MTVAGSTKQCPCGRAIAVCTAICRMKSAHKGFHAAYRQQAVALQLLGMLHHGTAMRTCAGVPTPAGIPLLPPVLLRVDGEHRGPRRRQAAQWRSRVRRPQVGRRGRARRRRRHQPRRRPGVEGGRGGVRRSAAAGRQALLGGGEGGDLVQADDAARDMIEGRVGLSSDTQGARSAATLARCGAAPRQRASVRVAGARRDFLLVSGGWLSAWLSRAGCRAAHMGVGAAAMHPFRGPSATTIAAPAFAARRGSKPRACGHRKPCRWPLQQTVLIGIQATQWGNAPSRKTSAGQSMMQNRRAYQNGRPQDKQYQRVGCACQT